MGAVRESPGNPFLMPIEDVYVVEGRGCVVAGRIARGRVTKGDPVEISGRGRRPLAATVSDTAYYEPSNVEAFLKSIRERTTGILLSGVERCEIERGMILAAPGAVGGLIACRRFVGDAALVQPDLGGPTDPITSGYQAHLYLYDNVLYDCTLTLPHDVKKAAPGDRLMLTLELDRLAPIDIGTQFFLKKGPQVIAVGVVAERLE